MAIYAKLGGYVGNEPGTTTVHHEPNRPGAPGPWELLRVTKRGEWYDVDFVGEPEKRPNGKTSLRLNEHTRLLETGSNHDGWGGQWNLGLDGKSLWIGDEQGQVTLQLEGYIVVAPLHLEQRGNDFVDANGNRIVFPGIDGFDDLWFRVSGRESELDALMRESVQIGMRVRRIWCMGDAGENQVFSLYPQNTTAYLDWLRSIVTYENSYGIIPLLTCFVDAQRVMPNAGDRRRFWSQCQEALFGIGSYLWSGGNQYPKNGFDPWVDITDPGHGVIWSRGSSTDDLQTVPMGAPASELHATRISFDRAIMDSTASPPNMRAIGGSTMVWMTEGNPFGDANGYTPHQAWMLGRGCSIDWALAVFHNRQSQRGQLMTDETARCAAEWVRGMRI